MSVSENGPRRSMECLVPAGNTLGEGPLWHPERNELFWFDILERKLHWCAADGGNTGVHELEKMASAAAWIDYRTLLVAAEDGFYLYDIEKKSFSFLTALEADRPENRSNDGRCDPWGRFWIGTMGRRAEAGAGALYILSPDLSLQCVRREMSIPNSIAFAPDGTRAYVADSAEGLIFALELNPETGVIMEERVFARIEEEGAGPDGSVVDVQGFLWNACWGASCVVRYRPDGTEDLRLPLPVSQPSCPAFGGPELKTLYATTAREGLAENALAVQPLAGGVFFSETEVSGLREHPFRLILAGRD